MVQFGKILSRIIQSTETVHFNAAETAGSIQLSLLCLPSAAKVYGSEARFLTSFLRQPAALAVSLGFFCKHRGSFSTSKRILEISRCSLLGFKAPSPHVQWETLDASLRPPSQNLKRQLSIARARRLFPWRIFGSWMTA